MGLSQEKTTTLDSSVGADDGQPLNNTTDKIIADENSKSKETEKYLEAYQRDVLRMMDPAYLHTVSMNELYETVYPSRPPLIDGLLYPGTYLFVGAPKLGKSFFMAQLAYHISTGLPLWNFTVKQGAVLYLALEDDYKRLQERLFRMFGTDSAQNLYFSISAKQLGNGLEEQLQRFTQEHSGTNLIIIDTLQKIREIGGDSYSYANDYEIITRLKQFANDSGVCLLLVHHTRKQQANDRFDMISGTNGLLGAADGAFLLQKEKRTSNDATLDISGRDQQDQRLYLKRDPETLAWILEKAETELWREPPDPILEAVASVVTEAQPVRNGSPTELVDRLDLDMKPNALTLRLNVKASRLLQKHGIRYESSRNHSGRNIKLALENPVKA
jgi:RecA-family ATPase